ncbi:MAG: polymer-forming cytoskeletal protein [Sulfurospirillaceae bacterium]|jgi:cytoskeletal protein CcmA (bactofilin family)|nr:polymer-forming cytoskeletal protein [Sulfurospirillaceae bacterium]MDY0238740.1 polymer-forming cytoskeletal protein [Campylobacterales bacterium]NLM98832.1 polymer-forming cytoskeletal protein [Campylobacteraceae bacterium]
MAIFTKNSGRSAASTETTLIAIGASIKGEFNLESRLHVDGEIEGNIVSSSVIVIGKKGRIKGDLKAEKLVVNGEFEGSADCSYVEVLASGRFIGNVLSKELMIESKAYFQGQSNIRLEEKSLFAQEKDELEAQE